MAAVGCAWWTEEDPAEVTDPDMTRSVPLVLQLCTLKQKSCVCKKCWDSYLVFKGFQRGEIYFLAVHLTKSRTEAPGMLRAFTWLQSKVRGQLGKKLLSHRPELLWQCSAVPWTGGTHQAPGGWGYQGTEALNGTDIPLCQTCYPKHSFETDGISQKHVHISFRKCSCPWFPLPAAILTLQLTLSFFKKALLSWGFA